MNHEQFEREMRRWANQNVPLIGKKIHAAVTEAVYQGIVQKTPVLTGRARGNWFPTNGAPSAQVGEDVAGVSVTGQPMTSEEKGRVRAVTSKLEALPLGAERTFITNNLDYILKLEEGSSPKAPPNAMVQQTIINTLDGLKVDIVLKGIR
jgi:hypothetical protein